MQGYLRISALTALLAVLYSISGWFGLALAIPPGYATVFWPASGIALAFVYIYGYGVLPGVFLGSFLLNGYNYYLNAVDPDIVVLFNGAGVGIGAMIQAWAGAWIVRRFVGRDNRLENVSDILKFCFLAGPLCCLISCSMSSTLLYVTGTVPLDTIPFTWGTWYVGDTLGVLTFTPILVLLLNRSGVKKKRKTAVALPLMLIFATVITLFFYIKHMDRRELEQDIQTDALLIQNQMTLLLKGYQQGLYAVQSFYGASEYVDDREFNAFTSGAFKHHKGIEAIGFAKWVTADEKGAALEELRALTGRGDAVFTQIDEQGRFVPADPGKSAYLPMMNLAPPGVGPSVQGFDFTSHAPRYQAIQRSIAANEIVATGPVKLLSETEDRLGLVAFLPVYKNGFPVETEDQRRKALFGVIVSALRYSDIIEQVMMEWRQKNINLRLYDDGYKEDDGSGGDYHPDNQADARRSHTHHPASQANGRAADVVHRLEDVSYAYDTARGSHGSGVIGDALIHTHISFSFAGRQWYLVFYTGPDYALENINWTNWYFLAGSLGFVFFVSAFLLTMTGQASVVENMVVRQTREITQNNQFLNLIMDNVPDLIFVKDSDFRIIQANAAFLEKYSFADRDALIGTTALEQFSEKERAQYLEGDRVALQSGSSENFEDITDYRGVTRTVFTKKVRFYDQDEQPYILGIARDVTDVLMAQSKLNAIVDTMPDGLITIRENGVVETYNKACEKIFGYGADEVIGKNISTLMPEKHARDHGRHLADYLQDNVSDIIGVGRELEAKHKSGNIFPIHLSVSEVSIGQRRFFSGIVRDITKTKQAEAELKRSNKELEDFAYVASHDLKSPLRHVSMSADFLKEEYAEKLDENGQHLIHIMAEATGRMQKMIDSLLAYSRVGRKEKEFENVDLNGVMEEVIALLEASINETSTVVEYQSLPAIRGDRYLLVQLFQNLIENSIKYRKEGVNPRIKVSVKGEGEKCELSVADNGIGIDREFSDRVFQVFQRLHTDDEYDGVGIGLSVCQRIVEFHNGEIWLDNNYEGGSKFSFTLYGV